MTKEIESSLRGTYVKNVYSLGSSQVLRFGRPGGEDVWLVASPKHGAWISQKVAERAETTEFTTRLRREVLRAKFVSAAQVDLDRIFDLTLGEGEHRRHLIVELMPPANMIVTDAELRLILALNEVHSPSRRVVRGGTYTLPPQRRKSPSDAAASDVSSALLREETAGGAVGRTFSLPRKYVAEVLARLGVEEDSPAGALARREEELVAIMRGLVDEAQAAPKPCTCMTEKGEEVFVVVPRAFKLKKRASSISELCDEFLLSSAVEEVEVAEGHSETRRRELEVTISKLKAQYESLLAEAARVREVAKNALAAPSVVEAAALLKSAGITTRKEFTSQEAAASVIYDRAKELEKKAADAQRAIEDLSRKRPKEERPERRGTKELRRGRQEWYERFRWFFTSGGKLAIGGRDAQSNSILVRRHLETNDTVYHADLFGSPFFVLKEGREQTEDERSELAQATVAFSSAWKTGLGSADAYWVHSDQVSSSAPSGEFLPRGGFLIRGKKNFVQRNLVELAVGLDPQGRLISGPESALKKAATTYVVIRPQKEKSSETAKRVLKDLESLVGEGRRMRVSVDEMLRMLPTGGGKVLRKHAGHGPTVEPRNA